MELGRVCLNSNKIWSMGRSVWLMYILPKATLFHFISQITPLFLIANKSWWNVEQFSIFNLQKKTLNEWETVCVMPAHPIYSFAEWILKFVSQILIGFLGEKKTSENTHSPGDFVGMLFYEITFNNMKYVHQLYESFHHSKNGWIQTGDELYKHKLNRKKIVLRMNNKSFWREDVVEQRHCIALNVITW